MFLARELELRFGTERLFLDLFLLALPGVSTLIYIGFFPAMPVLVGMIGRDFSVFRVQVAITVTSQCLVVRGRRLMLEWASQVEFLGHVKEWRLT